jgi:hypothetical protein
LLDWEDELSRDRGEGGFFGRKVELARRSGGGWFDLVFILSQVPYVFTGISYAVRPVPKKIFWASAIFWEPAPLTVRSKVTENYEGKSR